MRRFLFLAIAFVVLGLSAPSIFAINKVTFVAVINPGVLQTDIRDQNGLSIIQPTIDLGKVINTFDCRIVNGLKGTLGSNTQRIYVDNPKAAFDGWTLAIAPAAGSDAKWLGDNSEFDFNDPGLDGCIDSDSDGKGGLMFIDPSQAKINSDCLRCSDKHLLVGHTSQKAFSEAESITLLKATGDSDEVGRWYMTDIGIKQTIPSEQDGDSYRLVMVLTATATYTKTLAPQLPNRL